MSAAGGSRLRRAPPGLYALIAANAPLWAGEAEVFTTYFASTARTAATDALWLARQCYKELVDGVVARLCVLTADEASFDRTMTTADAALADDVVRGEMKHYIAFAIAHAISLRRAGEGAAPVGAIGSDWPENETLRALRARHRRDFGAIGARATTFTEGGYCTLYREGMALARTSELDVAIASACGQVYDDEWDHMLMGITGLAEQGVDASAWALLERLTVEQGRARIRMRNAQFGQPLSEARVRALEAGAASPLDFDYVRAGIAAP